MDNQSKMLDLLDRAYDVSDDIDRFDDLIETARHYFFETPESDTIAPSVPRYVGLDPYIEPHIPRLETLMSEASGGMSPGLSLAHHAQLTLGVNGTISNINAYARELLGGAIGNGLENLNLTPESLMTLETVKNATMSGACDVERMIYLQTRDTPQISAFGFCKSVKTETGNGFLISLSRFEWTEAIFKNLERALDLTESEGEVLRGTLRGMSQKDIAAARSRSIDTIKTQAKSVLRKSGCANMNDIVHLCTSIAYVIALSEHDHGRRQTSPEDTRLWSAPTLHMQTIPISNDRTLAYYEHGRTTGRPILYIHGFVQGPFFQHSMLQQFHANNLRVIAPSRPGFGFTSESISRENYDETVVEDTMTLIKSLDISEPLTLVAHQGGVSHAFRIAKRLEVQVENMIMIAAGIPITADHIKHMDRQTQLAAAATRHAPSVMKMMTSLAIRTYKRKGAKLFLEKYFEAPSPDRDSLNDPVCLALQLLGYYHVTQQGAETFIRDGMAAMADWTSDFDAVSCPQYWVHGAECPVMGAAFVEKYITSRTNYPVDVIEGVGFNILYEKPDMVMDKILTALSHI